MDAKINRYNYEAYALDYLENNLSREEALEFDSFLLQNPDIAQELNDFDIILLPKNDARPVFNKTTLLKEEPNRFIFLKIAALFTICITLGLTATTFLQEDTHEYASIDVEYHDDKMDLGKQVRTDQNEKTESVKEQTQIVANIDNNINSSTTKSTSQIKIQEKSIIKEASLIKKTAPTFKIIKKVDQLKNYAQASSEDIEIVKETTKVIIPKNRQITEKIEARELIMHTPLASLDLESIESANINFEKINLEFVEVDTKKERNLFAKWRLANTSISLLPSYMNAD